MGGKRSSEWNHLRYRTTPHGKGESVNQKSRVLVVEDDAGIRQSLFETLGALGFAIGEACNGEEALLRLRMVNYDAVLLEINIPGIGGETRGGTLLPPF